MGLVRSWFKPAGNPAQSGRPNPADAPRVPPWSRMQPNNVVRHTPIMVPDFGASAWTSIFGRLSTNPIGAGIVATARPQASYGPPGTYQNGIIIWHAQKTPTSVALNPLITQANLAAILGQINAAAAVRMED